MLRQRADERELEPLPTTLPVPARLERGGFALDLALTREVIGPRIRCPHCGWQPHRSDRWCCLPAGAPEHFSGGCGESWNTFDTHGRCPGCAYQWRNTACLSCKHWSPHEDWYADTPGNGPAP
jgi:hypothetical protein